MKKIFRNDLSRSDFLYQLSTLLEDGYTLSEAIQLYMEFAIGKKQAWIQSVYQQLLIGEEFSEQLVTGGFPKELVSYLSFVERYGDFQRGLLQASTILKKRDELKGKLRKILHYPVFLTIGLIIMGSVMIEGVLPQFEKFFDAMGKDLPWITRVVIAFSRWVQPPILIAILTMLMLLLFWVRRKPVFEQVSIMLKIPLINNYLIHLLTYYFTSQLAPMLKNGFSLQASLKIIETDSLLLFFQNDALSLSYGLEAGNSLPELINQRNYYLPQLSSVIVLGEKKGNLGEELERFANLLFKQMYDRTYRYLSLFQPIFLCIIGVFILFLFLAMLMPIFSLLEGW